MGLELWLCYIKLVTSEASLCFLGFLYKAKKYLHCVYLHRRWPFCHTSNRHKTRGADDAVTPLIYLQLKSLFNFNVILNLLLILQKEILKMQVNHSHNSICWWFKCSPILSRFVKSLWVQWKYVLCVCVSASSSLYFSFLLFFSS